MRKTVGLVVVFAGASLLAAGAQLAEVDRGYPGAGRDMPRSFELQPAPGVEVRSDLRDGVRVDSSSGGTTEIHVLKGRADVIVRHPEDGAEILVDLPAGQVALVKDGFYTFNAETRTLRVLQGEAVAYTGAADTTRGTRVKEAQQLFFGTGARLTAVDADRRELRADLLTGDDRGEGPGYGGSYGGYGGGGYGYGPAGPGYGLYGGGFGYPFYAGGFGYPFGYGFAPYGYGYPFGLGFGYYGSFGGYRGGFGGFGRGGFRR